MKNAALIYNPIAGRHPQKREKQVREAVAALEKQGIRTALAPTSGPGTATGLAQTLVAEKKELIIAWGGDGTINEVINGIAPGSVPLAILPAGTANIFARELALPLDPVRAARALGKWTPQRIALGEAIWPTGSGTQTQRRFFLSLAGIGFDAHIVYKLSLDFKRDWGVIAYVLEAIRQALGYSFPPFVCRLLDRQVPATFACVQRTTRYAGWLRMAPSADIFASEFSFCVFKSGHWMRYFLYASAVITRQHHRLLDVELVQAQKIDCESHQVGDRIQFELDGELAGQLPARFEIVPDALTVLLPIKKEGQETPYRRR